MTTLETITNDLAEAKKKMKVALATEVVVRAFQNKEQYKFESYSGTQELFRRETLISCASLTITTDDVKHYNEIHKINLDAIPENTKEIMKALKIIEANDDLLGVILNVITETL